MTPERWQSIENLFRSALEREPNERAAFLERACGDDRALLLEVESLVSSHHEAEDFLEAPAVEVAAKLLADEGKRSLVGQLVGPYKVLDLLGAGGMGEVYLALDPDLGRKVALKLLPERFTKDQELLERFKHEARSASALNHPNILTVHGIGQADDRHFIIMEFIDGITLRHRLASARMKLDEAIEIAIQVASALAEAHAVGIVHRDIKPENIMLRPDGYVKVLDFGLAKLTQQSEPKADRLSPMAEVINTEPGVLWGTASYMSPEQVRGLIVDARSDIWSLGTVIYEMVTGRLPFEGPTPHHVRVSILDQEPPPLTAHYKELPAELEKVITKTLAKEREARYQTAKELLVDLRRLKQLLDAEPMYVASESLSQARAERVSQEVWESRATSRPRYLVGQVLRHKIGSVLILAIIVAAAGGYWRMKSLAPSPDRPATYFQSSKIVGLTSSGWAVTAAISPDGKYFVYAKEDAGQQSLWGVRVDAAGTDEGQQIVPPSDSKFMGTTFSHDGQYVYYVVMEKEHPAGALYRVPILGGDQVKLLTNIETPITFSPDGKRFAYVSRDSDEQTLRIANADGSDAIRLAARKYPDFFTEPAWSPDGRMIACGAGSYLGGFYMTVVGVRVEDGNEIWRPPQKKWWSVRGLTWQPDGGGLLVIAKDQLGTPFHIVHLSYPDGYAQAIVMGLYDYKGVSLTADSTALVTVQSIKSSDFWIVPDGDTARAGQITFNKYDGVSGVSWAPPGRIVYASKVSENWNIWSMEADGSDKKLLTLNAGNNLDPSVSPDGRYIVFASNRSGDSNIWRMDVNGDNQRQLTNGPSEWWPNCSPDGRWVVYASFASGQPTLWRVSIDGGEPAQLTDKFSMLPAVSPDGKLIACYNWDGQSGFELKRAIIPFEGGRPIKTFPDPEGNFLPVQWSTDGRALTYIDNYRGVSNIYSQPIAGGEAKPLTDFKENRIFSFAWSPDGRRLVLSRGFVTNDVVLIQFKRP